MNTIKSLCHVCGANNGFIVPEEMTLIREAKCSLCGASIRQSDVARAIVETIVDVRVLSIKAAINILKNKSIYEAASSGPLHELLKHLPYYVCSEFADGVPPGTIRNRIRCEDLSALTFPDDSFDLVITQDVLEHVADPEKAFNEIRRVLRPGGYHIFTVPVHESRKTVSRVIVGGDDPYYVLPQVYHGDPLRSEGALVYTDFGDDLDKRLALIGMKTETKIYNRWYEPEEVTFVGEGEIYLRYLDAKANNKLQNFFRYNSIVLISQKSCLPFTGERFVPELGGVLRYEHLHRYAFAGDYVHGGTVLDIACGEGYGSNLLAQHAAQVVGVDVSAQCIAHAKKRYGERNNLSFIEASGAEIPCRDSEFDVVISYETIEHIKEQKEMLAELKRVLKDDGVLIISSPNKNVYKRDDESKNEYHVKELSLDEFVGLLEEQFRHVKVMGQRLTCASQVWPLMASAEKPSFTHYLGDASALSGSSQPPYEALYFIAVCSNADRFQEISASLFADRDDSLYKQYIQRLPRMLEEQKRKVRCIEQSYSWKLTAPFRLLMKILNGKFS